MRGNKLIESYINSLFKYLKLDVISLYNVILHNTSFALGMLRKWLIFAILNLYHLVICVSEKFVIEELKSTR